MHRKQKSPVLARLAWLYEIGLVLAVAGLLVFAGPGNTAMASEPLLTYETAPPGADPSWIVVYSDGQIERDLAPYMKQAGRQVGQLDSYQLAAVHRLVAALLDQESRDSVHASNGQLDNLSSSDLGEVILSVGRGGQSRTVNWRPVPGLNVNPVPVDADAVIASLLYDPLL